MRVKAGAIVYRLNKRKLEILLVHQSDKKKNLWSLPKGGVEGNEDFEQAARRELHEETSVAVGHLEFLGYVDYPKLSKRLYCFMATLPNGATLQCNQPEIDNANFFEVQRAKKMVDKRQRTLINTMQRILAFSTRKVKVTA
jgi:ADP-ribose pyrophosphatase YjhB (NUDIX family)